VVVLLVITLLIHREDLRNRLIRLAGRGRLTLTTRALDEVGQRIGRYLLGRSLVNAGFGAAVGFGLLVLGVPYAALWGLLAGTLRFVPSVGVWLVAPFPVALAFISSPGPVQAIAVFSLFLVLELLTTNVVESRACDRSIGVAPVPLLLAVMFWTLLWGIVGLVLATPLTICLAVLGKHVPQLELLGVLLGSRPALGPEARYYQRLLARDRYEAEAVVRTYLSEHPVEKLFDDVLVPALVLARRSRRKDGLGPEDEQFILQTTGELVEGLGRGQGLAGPDGDNGPLLVLGLPACDGLDETSLLMLRHLARAGGCDVLLAQGERLLSDIVSLTRQPAGAIVVSLAPGGLIQARYLCRRLRRQGPGLKIVLCRLGQRRQSERLRKGLLSAGADRVVTSLREACAQVEALSRSPASVQQAP
jgi:hypothetical protein